ncbi:hypothetical protein KHA80_12985 [Anaerobacillus sp. HL2]|nr:hypothetical protein KHA80_12985 [Anaerobacillus sp. HL2]
MIREKPNKRIAERILADNEDADLEKVIIDLNHKKISIECFCNRCENYSTVVDGFLR